MFLAYVLNDEVHDNGGAHEDGSICVVYKILLYRLYVIQGTMLVVASL